MPRFRFVALLLITGAGWFAAACASSDADDVEPLLSVDALTSDAGADAATDGGAGCGNATTQGECVRCVEGAQAAGFAAYVAIVRADVCDPANCAKDCGPTFCAESPTSPDLACLSCANDALTANAATVAQTCRADASCNAFQTALRGAACNNLPSLAQ